jgi:hypothetical protein
LGYRIYEIPIEYAACTRRRQEAHVARRRKVFVLLRIRLTTSEELFGKRDPYHEQRLSELSLRGLRLGATDETGESRGTLPG